MPKLSAALYGRTTGNVASTRNQTSLRSFPGKHKTTRERVLRRCVRALVSRTGMRSERAVEP